MKNRKSRSKTSGVFAIFHEVKCVVVARLSEGRSPEFRSYRRMSPWNSKQERFCDVFPVASLTILLLKDVP